MSEGARGPGPEPGTAYPSLQAATQEFEALARKVGPGVTPFDYGRSVQGRPLTGLRLPQWPESTSPGGPLLHPPRRVCVAANIHGVEFIGNRVAMGVLAALLSPEVDTPASQLRSRAEVLILPCLNPDAYEHVWETGGQGTVAQLRRNAGGVDLNRNYPLPRGVKPSRMPAAGSNNPTAATYRGPHPLSEPETRHLDTLLSIERPHVAVNLHSCMGTLIPARTVERDDCRVYQRLCRAAAKAQPHWPYRRLSSRRFDVFTGEQEDRQHHDHGTWAICLEVFPIRASIRQFVRPPRTFWRFNPLDPAPWVANDVPAVIACLLAGLDVGRRPDSRSSRPTQSA